MRLGSIGYINSLPVDWGLLSGAVPLNAEMIQGPPALLNAKLGKGELDLSPVSAFWYAQNQADLAVLPDFAIGSRSGVLSVLLVSRQPLSRLGEGARVAFGGEGRTTPALLEILCRFRYGVRPRIETAPASSFPESYDALLTIGDEALLWRERAEGRFTVTDLAEEWRAWTGLPIVFAVWAARRADVARNPERFAAAHEALRRSRQWGAEHPDDVAREAMRRTGLSRGTVDSYFLALSYDFGAKMREGLRLYLDYAAKAGLLASPAGEFEEIGLASAGKKGA